LLFNGIYLLIERWEAAFLFSLSMKGGSDEPPFIFGYPDRKANSLNLKPSQK